MIHSNLGPILHRLATIVYNRLQGHPRSAIYMSFEIQYATSY